MKMKRPFAREITLLKSDSSGQERGEMPMRGHQVELASGEGSQIITGTLVGSQII
jgi:hypothetical protein